MTTLLQFEPPYGEARRGISPLTARHMHRSDVTYLNVPQKILECSGEVILIAEEEKMSGQLQYEFLHHMRHPSPFPAMPIAKVRPQSDI